MTTHPMKWNLEVSALMACNCNFGCPCAFNAPPTYHTCEGVLAFQIDRGTYGDVDLEGLRWAAVVMWPGPIHEGKGRGLVYLDERADDRQREALRLIATGAAGGPIGVLMGTVTEGCEVRTAPMELAVDGKHTVLQIPDEVQVQYGPIRNPVSGAEHEAAAVLPTGMLTKREDFYSADTLEVTVPGFELSYPQRNGHTLRHEWHGP